MRGGPLLLPGQNFAYGRERAPHRIRAGGNGFIHARKITPANVANSRFEHNIRVPAPGRLQRTSMRCPEFRIENFHDIFRFRGCGIIMRGAYIDSQNASFLDSRSDGRRHGRYDAAIGQEMAFVLHRFHKTWKGATGADRQFNRSAGKYTGRAGVQVRGHDGHWNGKLFNRSGAKPFLDKLTDAISSLCPRIRSSRPKAQKIANAHAPAKIAEIADRNAVRIGRPEQRANACAYDIGYGQALLFEKFQNSQMCEASGKSAAQSQCNSRSSVPAKCESRLKAAP